METKVDKLLQIYKFTNELGENIIWTPTQKKIMSVILDLGIDNKHFIQIETATQMGKSSSVAAALLMRCTKKEKWAIVAGTSEKSQIIMNYFINYSLENIISRELLKNNENIDRLSQERSKKSLTFSSGFEIEVFSADGRNKQATGNAIMGFNAPFVILDEASLVNDAIEAKVFRMISGFSTTKHLYLKIGNPFYRNHFLKSHNDKDYSLLHFDYKVGIKEGRFSESIIEKAREKPGFSVLYEVKFPDADTIDDKGWSSLLTEKDIDDVMIENGKGFGFLKVGCDPAGEGANFNVAVKRYRNYANIIFKEKLLNQWEFTEKMINWKNKLKEANEIMPMSYFVDKIGIGEGYYQTMKLDLENVYGINVGVSAFDKDNYVNLRAEIYWKLRQDIKNKKLSLEKNDDWYQLTKIKYRVKLEGSKGKIAIMSKDEMRANGIESPDCFVAGTKVLTSNGYRNIEELQDGDSVITPFGHRTIIKKWEVETDKLCSIKFSNGSNLVGKPKHKILTKRGFISLDTLLLTDIIETRNNLSSILWKIKKLLFIKEGSIGLRKQADIFMPISMMVEEKKQERKKHYITKFGKILIIGKSLKNFVFTTLTTIITIINQKILNLFKRISTPLIISGNALMMKNTENQISNNLKLYDHLPLYGTEQKRELNSLKETENLFGNLKNQLKNNVYIAKKNLMRGSSELNSAQETVISNISGTLNFIILIKEFVYFVKKSLWQIGIGIQDVAVISAVSKIVSKVKVYNLTLNKDNVYYANGILVENCADALALTYSFQDPIDTIYKEMYKEEDKDFERYALFNEI